MPGIVRHRIFDYLQNYAFWLCDVSPASALTPFALNPVYGFSSITAPEVTLNMREINQCNRMFPVQVVESASLAALTLVRGATLADGDFWRWIRQVLHGQTNTLKEFLLIQFVSGGVEGVDMIALSASAQAALVGALMAGPGVGAAATVGSAFAVMQAAHHSTKAGENSWVPRMPARAWMLRGCKPTRYKVAGDFDATSSDVSLMELDMVLEDFEEFSLV